MPQQSEPGTEPKNKSWMYLVAAFAILVVIGILST